MSELLAALLAVSSWAAPQPTLSHGLLVTYGNQRLVEANAKYHGYDLSPYFDRCGLAAISPAELGRVGWVSIDGVHYVGPCLVVDVQGRDDAFDSIFRRHEVAEVSRATAAALGFTHGHIGYVYFGQCPPSSVAAAQPYAPARETWRWPWAPEPYHAYAKQQAVKVC